MSTTWDEAGEDARAASAGGLFTTRDDGNLSLRVGGGDPAAARARLAARLGVPALVWCEQVHGAELAYAGPGAAGTTFPGADALVTDVRGTALAVLVADCLPVLFVSAEGPVGAAHAGRRGLAAGVLEATVTALRERGARDIAATIGPGIGPCCYEVGDDVAAEVAGRIPVTRSRAGRTSLNLRAAAHGILRGLGVGIGYSPDCTYDEPRWFSHRRAPGEGRFAGVVVC